MRRVGSALGILYGCKQLLVFLGGMHRARGGEGVEERELVVFYLDEIDRFLSVASVR